MAKRGRPSIKYESFVEVWEQLTEDGRASINAVQNTLGGDKSTIGTYRERYEREKAAKELAMIKGIELTEALQKAIAAIKVKEIDALTRDNQQLTTRMDELLADLKKSEDDFTALKVEIEEVKAKFSAQRQEDERRLAIAESRVADAEKRERQLTERIEVFSEQIGQYKQEAAVAKKEVELLREQTQTKETH